MKSQTRKSKPSSKDISQNNAMKPKNIQNKSPSIAGSRKSGRQRRSLTGISFLNDDAHMHVTPTTTNRLNSINSRRNSERNTPSRSKRHMSEDLSARKRAQSRTPEVSHQRVVKQTQFSSSNRSDQMDSVKTHNLSVGSKISYLLKQVEEE
jgi:hypothetical protein